LEHSRRILIIGGYGTFGARLVRLLRNDPLTLIIAGRSLAAAQALCQNIAGTATFVAEHFDRDAAIDPQLERLSPHLVVDASGPFQFYGLKPYRVIEACIAHQIHYLDLADGASFVAGVSHLDARAKASGVFALSGLSSCPALTAAVTRRLMHGLTRLQSITAGISPSPRAGVGISVIRAIATYAGEPLQLRRDGEDQTSIAVAEQRRIAIAPPGGMPLRSRIFSLVDVPDLQLLPRLWPEAREVWVGAAPQPAILHRMLIVLAWLRRFRLLPSLTRFTRVMHWATRHCRWGEHRGGMFVSIDAFDLDGRRVRKAWNLVAEGDDGPSIPSMGLASLIRKWVAGEAIAAGARSGMEDIELADYERWFAQARITSGVRTLLPAPTTLFKTLLANAYASLPAQLRALHEVESELHANGVATVTRGNNWVARIIATIIGFPRAGADIPVEVHIERKGSRELWTRRFCAKAFHSEMSAGKGREEGLLIERFGPISIGIALVWDAPYLRFVVRTCRFGPIPLPLWLAPASDTHESVIDGRFCFDVSITHPLVGLLVRYRGWLIPGSARAVPRGSVPANR
jgi:hypothetical protein